jgi:peptide/nickel transport system permease protein
LSDNVFTFFGFIGLSIPNFLLALVFIVIGFFWFGQIPGGLFSPQFADQPWSVAKFLDLLSHLWIPVIVLGTAGTAGTIRVLRGNMLEEMTQPYVDTARAKGLKERTVLLKYPLRIALNPFITSMGYFLPGLISGEVIVSIVLNLPTTGPLLYDAIMHHDAFLAGGMVMVLSVLLVVGNLLADLLLAWVDPRIRYTSD